MGVWSKEHLVESVRHLAYNGRPTRATDVYEFGVYRGESLQLIETLFYAYQLPLRVGFGFDSFEGLPDEEEGVERFYLFEKGIFGDITRFYPLEKSYYVKCWFSELEGKVVEEGTYGRALLVHIDSDLYISAKQALGWLFANSLILPGTVIAYDEFRSTEDLWAGGESRAHKEIAEQYQVTFREIFRNVYHDRIECWQNAFVVEGFGGADHGIR